ncbi:alpha/beta fold hydrolase [Winogradskyella litorisediminis]|uniref:Alpha/beta fold hydrolase n=1 Tax=Winogradskyella litorisediminis TaxID=1156618 RepID=A0ABW3N8E3_9FLAO
MSNFIIKSIGNTLNAASYISARYASNKALKLFSTPRKGRYSLEQESFIKDAKKNTISYQDLSIAVYHWKGKGKTVLLAHGWESNASRWSYILEKLKDENYNIIALDAPAHGFSDGKLFNAVLYSNCINEVAKIYNPDVLIGHSVGGMASIFCLFQNDLPSVKKLVSLGAPAHFVGVFGRYKDMMGYNNRISKTMDKLVEERFGMTTDYFSAAKFIEDLDVETLIIHDKNDKIIPYEDALLFQKHYKNGNLITTKGQGHGLRGESTIPQIIEFIKA